MYITSAVCHDDVVLADPPARPPADLLMVALRLVYIIHHITYHIKYFSYYISYIIGQENTVVDIYFLVESYTAHAYFECKQ